jgi:hypothetical protein
MSKKSKVAAQASSTTDQARAAALQRLTGAPAQNGTVAATAAPGASGAEGGTTGATPTPPKAKKGGKGKGAKAAAPAKPAKEPKAAKAPKAAKPPKEKKVSGLDAAAMVLAKSKVPMNCKAIFAETQSQKLWKTNGATPEATLYAAIIREIAAKGKESRFAKTDRGLFTARKGA